MITKVLISDKNNLPFEYASSLEAFADGKEYVFKPGVNVVVGNNGSGKSTLLGVLAMYMMCYGRSKSSIPKVPFIGYLLPEVFGPGGNKIRDGLKICSDYAGIVYNYVPYTDIMNDKASKFSENAAMVIGGNTMSSGERQINFLNIMFSRAFENIDVQFPISKLKDICQESEIYTEKVKMLLRYYKENQDKSIRQEDFEFTFLIDEPDKNLDIHNIDSITNMFSYHKENTQIIAAIHNPVVLYKLKKTGNVNFVEMTEGYMDAIDEIFKNI